MTIIELQAILPAPPPAVWAILLDDARWPAWALPAPPRREQAWTLETIEVLEPHPGGVGHRRRGVISGSLPLGRRWRLTWLDCIADAAPHRLLEYERLDGRALRRCRLRLILVPHPGGQTRLRARLTYHLRTPAAWLLDRLLLRRRLSRLLAQGLEGLRRHVAASPAADQEAWPPLPQPLPPATVAA